MKIKLCYLLWVSLLFCSMVSPLLAGDVEFEASGAILSHYMWRGQRVSEGGVFQPSLTVGYKGFSANIWGNRSFKQDQTNEVDFTVSYAGEKDKYNYEFGFIHYGVINGIDSDEFYTSLGYSNALNPNIKAYFDVNNGKGAYFQAGLEPSIPLGKEVSLNFKTYIGYVVKNSYMGTNDEGREFSNFYNADFITSLTLPLGKGFSLEPMIGYSTSLSQNARQAIKSVSVGPSGDTLYGGATLTFSF